MSEETLLKFCAHEFSTLDAIDTRWQKKRLTWRIAGELPGVISSAFHDCAAEAFASWAAVADLSFSHTDNPADITLTTGRIDGSGGTLAWSELPGGGDRPLDQKYDFETWATVPGGKGILLVAVICHEVGHALGLQHDGQNTGALMAPYYSPNIKAPQSRDVTRIQALYGRPTPTTPPTPPAGPAPGGVIIRIDGAEVVNLAVQGADRITIPGYRVIKE